MLVFVIWISHRIFESVENLLVAVSIINKGFLKIPTLFLARHVTSPILQNFTYNTHTQRHWTTTSYAQARKNNKNYVFLDCESFRGLWYIYIPYTAQFVNLCNFKIVLRRLEIANQSWNCAATSHILETMQEHALIIGTHNRSFFDTENGDRFFHRCEY